ncbi:Thiosulfate/3-mercaptopyruvate sulfurtransferase 1, mitochondrial [Porphyridium purpureum]|uniref:Sulfurtransferase n=1 Tax=Porphyridium purpureum TaxID=35688 RepID=A0A5J4YNH5_PORPP|nr:Thiosulfate/3-mercaptopyruvate sulfurtransferase 1, mitochondrial [Porphyridium purpureum]|eukprot:POR3320..scf295_9
MNGEAAAFLVLQPLSRPLAAARRRMSRPVATTIRRFTRMALAHSDRSALVDLAWLKKQDARSAKILDASWWMPNVPKDKRYSEDELQGFQQKLQQHLLHNQSGIQRFDIDVVKDTTNTLPHMLPTLEQMANHLAHMGLSSPEDDVIVVYSTNGFVASARCWWMLRAYSFQNVFVIDGGIDPEKDLLASASSGEAPAAGTSDADLLPLEDREKALKATMKFRPELVWNKQDVLHFVAAKEKSPEGEKIFLLDARSEGRFKGTEPEPRAGLASGHVPGSFSVPFQAVLQSNGKMRRGAALREAFASTGLFSDDATGAVSSASISCTCGSGVTAGVVALALHEAGLPDASVYDGSWTEYGADASCPKEV